ncbi:MAG: hypothetical protein GWO20_16645 [Candidatus Korarchaeota archaeon]|nr:hypothetical protein [Candidatus Korarchaeota archaeon]
MNLEKREERQRRSKEKGKLTALLRGGKSPLERNLTATALLTLPFALVAAAYWVIERTYNKWVLLVFLSFLLFVGSFGLRTFLIEKKEEVAQISPEEAKGMGFSLNKAREYEEKRVRVKIFKQWSALVLLTLFFGGVILLWWPV